MTDVANERINGLVSSIERLDANNSRMEAKIDGIGESLRILAKLEERHEAVNARLTEGAKTMGDLRQDVSAVVARVQTLELKVPENLGTRLHNVEIAMPGLKEVRGWVITGVLAGIGMMGVAMVSLVMKG